MRHSHGEPSCQCLWDWPLTQRRQQPPSSRDAAVVEEELKSVVAERLDQEVTAARTFNHTPAGTYLRREGATGGSSAVSARHECRVCHHWRVWVTLCVFQNVLSQQSAFLLQLYFSNVCLYPSKLCGCLFGPSTSGELCKGDWR